MDFLSSAFVPAWPGLAAPAAIAAKIDKPVHATIDANLGLARSLSVLNLSLPAHLGQHFLADREILARLAEAACGEHTPRTIEIGPGKGALTRYLLDRTDELHAVELDPSLVRHLERHFAGDARLHVHHADVLETDLTQWGPAAIAGNLPYYITSPIIEKFLDLDDRFRNCSFPYAVGSGPTRVSAAGFTRLRVPDGSHPAGVRCRIGLLKSLLARSPRLRK